MNKNGLQRNQMENLHVGVGAGDVVDDVDDVSRVEHVAVVGDLLQHLRRRVAVDDDATIKIFVFWCFGQGNSL